MLLATVMFRLAGRARPNVFRARVLLVNSTVRLAHSSRLVGAVIRPLPTPAFLLFAAKMPLSPGFSPSEYRHQHKSPMTLDIPKRSSSVSLRG